MLQGWIKMAASTVRKDALMSYIFTFRLKPSQFSFWIYFALTVFWALASLACLLREKLEYTVVAAMAAVVFGYVARFHYPAKTSD